jgi:hypothetical protein
MLIDNMQSGERYSIRNLSMSDALSLRREGKVFYDYTKLTAMNTCPAFGVLRYGLHKTDYPLSMGGRRTALECGKACHDFFSALRMWTVTEQYGTERQYMPYGLHLFGRERWQSMCTVAQDSDRINNAQMFALDALHTSGYYDDPDDMRRTMTNMESACLVYADRYFRSDLPVYTRDELIGVELPFVLEVINVYDGQTSYYCGRIDGIHVNGDRPIVVENKTAARMSDSWRMAFAISHQITGYTIAASAMLDQEISEALVMGVQIPLPRDAFNGVSVELCTRTHDDRVRWCEWFFQSVAMYEAYVSRPTLAPRYSHSCNRYFSACEFIPFCALPRDEQEQALTDMREEEWSPLDHIAEPVVAEGG